MQVMIVQIVLIICVTIAFCFAIFLDYKAKQ